MIVIAGLLFANTAFAARWQVTAITVGAQGGPTATYGAAASPTYTITLTRNNVSGTQMNDVLAIAFTDAIPPTGVTFSPATYNPGNGATFTLTATTSNTTLPGTYHFTITNTDNNGIPTHPTTSGTLTVLQKPLTVGGTLDASNKPYDGTTAATLTGTGALVGIVGADNVTLVGTPTGVFQSAAAGNQNVTVSGYTLGGTAAARYTLTQPTVNATITTIPLTITATGPAKTYGTGLTTITGNNFTATATLAGETVTSVTLTPNAAGTSTTTAAGAAYIVTPSAATGTGGFAAGNYNITYVAFNGTVAKAPLTITANDANKAYGTLLTSGSKNNTFFTVTGLKNGQTLTSVTITYTTGAAATDAVGNYANQVTPSAPTGGTFSAANYTFNFSQGDINVTAAALAVKATSQTKAYGAAVPTLTFTTTGFVNGDDFTTQPTLTTTATAASNAGTYPITFATQGTVSTNYTVTYTAGTLTVSAEPSLYDWTGAANTAWNNPANWNVNGIPQTTLYPGSTSNDDAQIGVTGTFTNQPVISATVPNSLNSLTFGNSAGSTTLTVNTGITFNSGNFTVNTGSQATLANNGAVTFGAYTAATGATLTVSGKSSFSNTGFSFAIANAGTLTQTGTGSITFAALSITNSGTINQSGDGSMSMQTNIFQIANSGTINQSGAGTIVLNANFAVFGVSIANSGTIAQTGTGKITFVTAYSNSTAASILTQTGTGTLAFSNTFSNSGTTTFGPGTVTMANTFTNTSGTTAFGTGTATIAGDFTNSGTITSDTGPITITGSFTNNSAITFGTGLVTFNSASSSTTISVAKTTSVTFNNVLFTKGGFLFKTNAGGGSAGNFFVSSLGVMTLSSSAKVNVTNSTFTLNSDSTGSATIAAIPTGCTITGTFNVQRFFKGGAGHRGYRLITSTVYTSTTAGGVNIFDLNYLLSKVYISGFRGATNGFNAPTTQTPSTYLFREDNAPPPTDGTLFTTGFNWKGIAKLNNPNVYDIGTQAKATPNNIADTTINLPVGNGILFFFRGNLSPANLVAGSTPQSVTVTQTGTLNTGPINVKMWFADGANNLGYNLSYTASTDTGNHALKGGYNLVGNPYPSTINWEKYNNTNAPGAITGTVPATIWMFNPVNKQYESYIPLGNDPDVSSEFANGSSAGGTAIGAASNFIASGQGFFVKASAIGQTLSFSETAKISAQPTVSNLNMLMGKPKDIAVAPRPLLRLKLLLDSVNTDEIAIRLDNKANVKFVSGEDAEDLGGSGALVSLSSLTADSVQSAINSMPFPGLKPQVISLLVSSASSGSYKLVMPQLRNLPALYEVWLKDAFTADSVQLTEGTIYTFTIDKANPATFGKARFSLVIRQNPANAYKLLDFTATKADHKTEVELVWKTANEGNYTNFTVERSADNGKTFQVIGGMHSTDAGTYSLLDKKPDNGKNFYRLKQEDINDTITYSKVVEVKYGDKRDRIADNVHIYPNPASHTINLSIDDKDHVRASYSIRFMNCFGLIIKQVNSSDAEWQGNISNLRPGTYLVRVVNNKTEKLVGENKFVKL